MRRPRKLQIDRQPKAGQRVLAPYVGPHGEGRLRVLGAKTEPRAFPGATWSRTFPVGEEEWTATAEWPATVRMLPVLAARLVCRRHHLVGYVLEGEPWAAAIWRHQGRDVARAVRPGLREAAACRCRGGLSVDGDVLLDGLRRGATEIVLPPLRLGAVN